MLRNILLQPITHVQLWTLPTTDIQQIHDQESDALQKRFLQLLLAIKGKLGSANQVYYPAEQVAVLTELDELIKTIPEANYQLRAAAENLKAIALQKYEKQYTAAQAIYHRLLSQAEALSPAARLCMWSNCILAYVENKEIQQANYFTNYVLTHLRAHLDDTAIPAQVRASVYSTLGLVKAKLHDSLATELYEKSLQWENNVLGNNVAIMLSKINDEKSLLLAESILVKYYPNAVENLLFVTPFYRADVNIKLAMYQSGEARTKYLANAQEYANIATAALKTSKYKEPYITKGQARLAYLDSNKATVTGSQEEFAAAKQQAINLRAAVTGESDAKKDKFAKKIEFGRLFRYDTAPKIQEEKVATQSAGLKL